MSQENFAERLNQAVQVYENLYFGHVSLAAPYYINYPALSYEATLKDKFGEEDMQKVQDLRRGQSFLPFAFQGKGTPGEIIAATQRVAEHMREPLENLSAEGILLLMRLFGIGVDCSGFVFNVLASALGIAESDKGDFLQGLEGRGVFRANVKKFAAPENSEIVNFESLADLKPGDIVVDTPQYTHIQLVTKVDVDSNIIELAHSAMYTLPSGVNRFEVNANNLSELSEKINALPNVHLRNFASFHEVRRLRVTN